MKIETKELAKLVKLLEKEGQTLVNLTYLDHNSYLKAEFADAKGHQTEVRIAQHDSQVYSKIIREERF